jgi:hypothetical protein
MTSATQRRFAAPHPAWLLGLGLCLIAIALNLIVWVPYYRTRAAVARIERLGGKAQLEAGGSNRMRQWLGDELMSLFDDVTSVDLSNTAATDADLEQLQALRHLRMLDLFGQTRVTEAGVQELRQALPRLVIRRSGEAVLGVGGGPTPAGFAVGLVQPGSGAEQAQLKVGDVLTHFDGQPLADFPTLVRLVSAKRPGDKVQLDVLRLGSAIRINVTLGTWK